MTPRELRDLVESTQAENRSLRASVEATKAEAQHLKLELQRLAAQLEAARLENDRLAGLWVKQHLNPHDQATSAIDIVRLMAYLKGG